MQQLIAIYGVAAATPANAGVDRQIAGVENSHPRGWIGVTRRKSFRILIDVWGWGRAIAVIAASHVIAEIGEAKW